MRRFLPWSRYRHPMPDGDEIVLSAGNARQGSTGKPVLWVLATSLILVIIAGFVLGFWPTL